jgi:hypothetical protein
MEAANPPDDHRVIDHIAEPDRFIALLIVGILRAWRRPTPRVDWFHRRFWVWNPNLPHQSSVRAAIELILTRDNIPLPLFQNPVTPLVLQVVVYAERPACHFEAGAERHADNLRAEYRGGERHVVRVPDLDNLVKNLMDSMMRVVYHDDAQIVRIQAEKVYDNTGTCNGHVALHVCAIGIDLTGDDVIDLTGDDDVIDLTGED